MHMVRAIKPLSVIQSKILTILKQKKPSLKIYYIHLAQKGVATRSRTPSLNKKRMAFLIFITEFPANFSSKNAKWKKSESWDDLLQKPFHNTM